MAGILERLRGVPSVVAVPGTRRARCDSWDRSPRARARVQIRASRVLSTGSSIQRVRPSGAPADLGTDGCEGEALLVAELDDLTEQRGLV